MMELKKCIHSYLFGMGIAHRLRWSRKIRFMFILTENDRKTTKNNAFSPKFLHFIKIEKFPHRLNPVEIHLHGI